MQPHKYEWLIKKWAEGWRIEFKGESSKKWLKCNNPAWRDDLEYRLENKHRDLIRLFEEGAQIQYRARNTDIWVDAETPSWDETLEYRVKYDKDKDPYAVFRQAQMAGKQIQFHQPPVTLGGDKRWIDIHYSPAYFTAPPSEYRIKPKWADAQQDYLDGKPMEIRFKLGNGHWGEWCPVIKMPELIPEWEDVEFRVNPYAEFQKAKAEGKMLQIRTASGRWMDRSNPTWTMAPEDYRIKPEMVTVQFELKSSRVGAVTAINGGTPNVTAVFAILDNKVELESVEKIQP